MEEEFILQWSEDVCARWDRGWLGRRENDRFDGGYVKMVIMTVGYHNQINFREFADRTWSGSYPAGTDPLKRRTSMGEDRVEQNTWSTSGARWCWQLYEEACMAKEHGRQLGTRDVGSLALTRAT